MRKLLALFALLFATTTFAQVQPSGGGGGGNITPTGAPTALSAANLAAQQGVLIDAFKVAGDTDDTQSFVRADAACVPILLGPKTYVVNNFSTGGACASFVLKGVKGLSKIQRTSASGSQWFQITGTNDYIDGVIFDENSGSVTANQHGVYFSTAGASVRITSSLFENNSGTFGPCLEIVSTGPAAGGGALIDHNEFTNCIGSTLIAINLASIANVTFESNYLHDSELGVYAGASGTASSTNYATNVIFSNNMCVHMGECALMGQFAYPYAFGTPSITNGLMIGNKAVDQHASYPSFYMFTTQGDNISFIGNKCETSSASAYFYGCLDNNARYTFIEDNKCSSDATTSAWCYDVGSSINVDIKNNTATLHRGVGFNLGAAVHLYMQGNTCNMDSTAGYGACVTTFASETDGLNRAFPFISSDIVISHNTFNLTSSSNINGAVFYDNTCGYVQSGTAQACQLRDNDFNSIAPPDNDIGWFGTGASLEVQGNRHNGTSVYSSTDDTFNGFRVPLVYDEAIDTSSNTLNKGPTFANYLSFSGGAIIWMSPTSGGSGYTAATTTISLATCTGGSGFAASPQVNAGVLVGIRISNHGAGYSAGCTAVVTDTGSGSGAVVTLSQTASWPANKHLRINFNGNSVATNGTPAILGPSGTSLATSVGPIDLQATGTGLSWSLIGAPPGATAVYAIGSLPTCNSAASGTVAFVTGTSIGWQVRCMIDPASNYYWTFTDGTATNAPTFNSGFGTSPTFSGRSAYMIINVGTGGTASSGVINLFPQSQNGWMCDAWDASGAAGNITRITASSTTTATLTNFSSTAPQTATAWGAGSSIVVKCRPGP